MKKSKYSFTDEESKLLKIGERSEINKEKETYGALGALAIGTMFLLALTVISLLLWFNKLTIFISSAMLLLNLIVVFLARIQFKTYTGAILKAKKRIDEELNKSNT